MEESRSFFKAFPEKGLCKGSKKSKQCSTIAFFVAAANGSKVSEPGVVWKSKWWRCFEKIQNKARPSMVGYFSNKKAWMSTEIM